MANVDDNSTKENHFQTNEKFDCKVDDAIIGMDDCQFVTSLAFMTFITNKCVLHL